MIVYVRTCCFWEIDRIFGEVVVGFCESYVMGIHGKLYRRSSVSIIGSEVIGHNATLKPGSAVGNGALVLPHSTVTGLGGRVLMEDEHYLTCKGG